MTVVASKYERQPQDLYETDVWATEVVIRFFPAILKGRIWEPAAGNHKMADVLVAAGAEVVTSDIVVHRCKHDFLFDFLADAQHVDPDYENIVTNPPYGRQNETAVKFAEKALERCDGYVAMLLTAKFDFGKTRVHLFRDNRRFLAKISLLDRIMWFQGKDKGTENHAWYVWQPSCLAPVKRPQILYGGALM